MASLPDLRRRAQFVDGISQTEWATLNDNPDHPLVNRATQGQYAPGSTFKLVSALAMTQYGDPRPGEWITDKGSVSSGRTSGFKNAGGASSGRSTSQGALTRSSDVYFYTAGNEFWQVVERRRHRARASASRRRRAEFGLRRADRHRARRSRRARSPTRSGSRRSRTRTTRPRRSSTRTARGIPGDDIHTRGRSGRLVVTPLQLANAYAAFANGGTLWQPHIEQRRARREASTCSSTSTAEGDPPDHLDPNVRAAMLAGFAGVTADEKGTAYAAFAGLPARPDPGRGQDRNRAGRHVRRQGRHVAVRGVLPGERAAVRRRRRRRRGRLRRADRGADRAPRHRGDERPAPPADPCRSLDDGARLMATLTGRLRRHAARAGEASPLRHVDLVLLALPFAHQRRSAC